MFNRFRYWLHEKRHTPDHKKKWPDLPVKFLIYERYHPDDGAYVIFLDFENDLDWRRDDDAEKCTANNEQDANIADVLNRVSMLEPRVNNWPTDLKIAAKRMLGEAMARSFRCEPDAAKGAIENAEQFMEQKSQEVSRYWTLLACGTASLFTTIAGFAILCWRSDIDKWFSTSVSTLLVAACAGCLGAFLSVILRLGDLTFDASAERRLHYAEGFARIIAGGISGFTIGCLVKLGIILPVFDHAGMADLALCSAALIGGASERLVPAIITKIEGDNSFGKPEK